jgi:hypothetical protein
MNRQCECYDNSPLERGCVWICCGGGVLADMFINTPLHPSQEGNRTGPAINHTLFTIFQSLKTFIIILKTQNFCD